jgi:lysyl-tRNA synthetase class 2
LTVCVLRLERHPHGPRVYVLGRRIHEYELGLALAFVALLWAAGDRALGDGPGTLLALGLLLVAKDARDLFPRTRDTGAWRVGLHRRVAPLRTIRHADGLPSLAGAAAFAIGGVNLVSAATPNLAWRGRLLLSVMPLRAVPVLHTLAVPASVALVASAFYLRRRRRRALQVAVALLVSLGVLNVLKGLDVEEALLSWAGAAVLWWGRGAFTVAPARIAPRKAVALGVALAAAVSLDLLVRQNGASGFQDELSPLPWLIGAATVVLVLVAAAILFRPLPPSRSLPRAAEREAARGLVRAHGSDTLAYFKLRHDKRYLFGDGGRAFLGYRDESGVMLVSGDPVGPADALRELVRAAAARAEMHGLRLAVLGASARTRELWRDAGLRSLYLGDEAIVETAGFSLEGRAIRKVRQSTARLERAGYAAELAPVAELEAAQLVELERVSALWRDGDGERGFSMAMDGLRTGCDGVVLVARDGAGVARGFLHFVPSYGRAAMSLSLMRRDRATPNGLTEFLVSRAIELLRARGVEEVSLNFAAFGRLLDRPQGGLERVLGRLVLLAGRWFQIESLYRFNAKFGPRWEPRYLLYEGRLGLPRAGMAALWAEGQLPRLPYASQER